MYLVPKPLPWLVERTKKQHEESKMDKEIFFTALGLPSET